MKGHETEKPNLNPVQGATAEPIVRRPYTPPNLERLGEWSALTLQQSIPIGPGDW